MSDNQQPIIIKKVKKSAGGHHGGAWKVAYADFVTAMMAFFLLLWLLNATTDDQKAGIADYFTPASMSKSKSGAGGMLGGLTVSTPGAMQERTAAPSISVELKPTSGADEGDAEDEGGKDGTEATEITEDVLDEAVAQREEARFAEAQKRLRQAIQDIPELRSMAENLVVDNTPEGLRIQIVDQEGKPMFASGRAEMLARARKLMAQIALIVNTLPNQLAISGHTDSTPFRSASTGHGNWELSSFRALASRRALVGAGIPVERIVRITGKADTEPLDPEDPGSARNRRISIVLLRQGATGSPTAASKRKNFRRDWTGPRLR